MQLAESDLTDYKYNLRQQVEVQVKGFAKGPSLLTTISDIQL